MRYLAIIMFLSIFYNYAEASDNCLGINQTKDIMIYDCITANTLMGVNKISELVTDNSVAYTIFSIDSEVIQAESPPKYLLAVRSLDIGEPVLLFGLNLKRNVVLLRFNTKTQNVELVDFNGMSILDFNINGLDDIKISGLPFPINDES